MFKVLKARNHSVLILMYSLHKWIVFLHHLCNNFKIYFKTTVNLHHKFYCFHHPLISFRIKVQLIIFIFLKLLYSLHLISLLLLLNLIHLFLLLSYSILHLKYVLFEYKINHLKQTITVNFNFYCHQKQKDCFLNIKSLKWIYLLHLLL